MFCSAGKAEIRLFFLACFDIQTLSTTLTFFLSDENRPNMTCGIARNLTNFKDDCETACIHHGHRIDHEDRMQHFLLTHNSFPLSATKIFLIEKLLKVTPNVPVRPIPPPNPADNSS